MSVERRIGIDRRVTNRRKVSEQETVFASELLSSEHKEWERKHGISIEVKQLPKGVQHDNQLVLDLIYSGYQKLKNKTF